MQGTVVLRNQNDYAAYKRAHFEQIQFEVFYYIQRLAYKLAICQVYKIRCCSGMAQYKIFINGSFETAFSQFSSNNSKISKISRLLNF